MESFNWPLLFGGVAVLFVVAVSYFFRPRPRCSECKSYKVSIVKKEPQTTTTHVYPGSPEGGPTTTASISYLVQYRCNDCKATWVNTVIDSK